MTKDIEPSSSTSACIYLEPGVDSCLIYFFLPESLVPNIFRELEDEGLLLSPSLHRNNVYIKSLPTGANETARVMVNSQVFKATI